MKEGEKAALGDATVRLVYDMYHKLGEMVEQMQGMDEATDENEEDMADLHEAEDTLVGRAVAWLQANGVPKPWRGGL